jgi:hypothetical protein
MEQGAEYRLSFALSFMQRLTIITKLILIARHADSSHLQICRGPWLLATTQLLSKLPGTIGGLNKASLSRYSIPMADPNLRISS